jgi:hypothetical protein
MGGAGVDTHWKRGRIVPDSTGGVVDTLPDGPVLVLEVLREVAQIGAGLLEGLDEAVQVGHRPLVFRNVGFGERVAGIVFAPGFAFSRQGSAQLPHGSRHIRPDLVEPRCVIAQLIRVDRKLLAHTFSLRTAIHCPGSAVAFLAYGEIAAARAPESIGWRNAWFGDKGSSRCLTISCILNSS